MGLAWAVQYGTFAPKYFIPQNSAIRVFQCGSPTLTRSDANSCGDLQTLGGYMKTVRCGRQVGNGSFRTAITVRLLLLVVLFPLTQQLKAQTFHGAIVGTVTDSSGAGVPGATVTITNSWTNVKRS